MTGDRLDEIGGITVAFDHLQQLIAVSGKVRFDCWICAAAIDALPGVLAEAAALRAQVQAVEARALDAIKMVPRRSGRPEWDRGRAVAQAAGFDLGLAVASDAVRAALLSGSTEEANHG